MAGKDHTVSAWISYLLIICCLSACNGLTKAHVRMEQGDYEEAIQLYEEHLEKHPDSLEARRELGFAHLKAGFPDPAIAELESVLEVNPYDPDALLYVGLAYLDRGSVDEALAVFQDYQNRKQPLLEAEVKHQMILLEKLSDEKALDQAQNRRIFVEQFEAAVHNALSKQEAIDQRMLEAGGDGAEGGSGGCGCE